MTLQTMTLNLPGPLYNRLKQRAERSRRTVEAEAIEAIAVEVRADELPADLAQIEASLSLLDDTALWRAAQSRLPTEVATQIEDLHLKRQFEGLTPNETQVLATLMRRYEQTMLVRAHATLLLKQRGHDVSPGHESSFACRVS
jgi:plasmid stability protein